MTNLNNYSLNNINAKNNVTNTYKTTNKLESILRTDKIVDSNEKIGTYKLSCKECPSFHIG